MTGTVALVALASLCAAGLLAWAVTRAERAPGDKTYATRVSRCQGCGGHVAVGQPVYYRRAGDDASWVCGRCAPLGRALPRHRRDIAAGDDQP